ncbi:hypothetical protein [Thiocystis violacea]|uniref:hypothetical protein n=1 Tax=Thiocystis violacea TaxID=13725 RepID=UPI001906A3EE|nr:hypothetical protein [Thiocystis violacea]
MPFQKLNLTAPNGLPIIGAKLEDGKVDNIECHYDRQSNTQDWIVPHHLHKENECYIFVDASGQEWLLDPSDVVLDSLKGI